jgi:hypothetical protein
MQTRLLTPVLSTLVLALGGLAACEHGSTDPDRTEEASVHADVLQPLPLPQPIPLNHPWIGRQVRIRDFTGDHYDRCLGADALPAANVHLSAQLCLPTGLDTLQWFTVIGVVNTGFPIPRDAMAVGLQSIYNPGFCADVEWGTANGGELIQLYPCHGGTNQRFHLPLPATTAATSATGSILTKNSNYTMAFEAGAPDSRGSVKPVWQRLFSSTASFQQWTVQVR